MFTGEDLNENGYFADAKTKSIIKDVSNGLKFLHENGIVHGEITPHNIMIDASGNAKITGLDRRGDIKSKIASLLAPELLKMLAKRHLRPTQQTPESNSSVNDIEGTKQSDVFQLGSLISTMLYGRADTVKTKKIAEEGES